VLVIIPTPPEIKGVSCPDAGIKQNRIEQSAPRLRALEREVIDRRVLSNMGLRYRRQILKVSAEGLPFVTGMSPAGTVCEKQALSEMKKCLKSWEAAAFSVDRRSKRQSHDNPLTHA
jgi:hypothetical protein